MHRAILALGCLVTCLFLLASEDEPPLPSFAYDVARQHEIKPYRHTIPTQGVHSGFNEMRVMLTVSPDGDVTKAEPGNGGDLLKFWPTLQNEILQWKFTPFEKDGKRTTAAVEEYVSLVPPERFPTHHVTAPAIRPNSKITIRLSRSVCYGRCPSYTVTVSRAEIIFDGDAFVAATGRHTDMVDANEVRKLAKKFVDADFYSMDPEYRAGVTDNPTYTLSISIDGHSKKVTDYVGAWVGMPAVINELEDDVDALAQTDRWIKEKSETH
jgi:hypothetical protein